MIYGAPDAVLPGTAQGYTGGLGPLWRQPPTLPAAEVGKISTPTGVLQLGTRSSSSSTPPSPRRHNQVLASLSPRSHVSSQPGTLARVQSSALSRSPPRSPTLHNQERIRENDLQARNTLAGSTLRKEMTAAFHESLGKVDDLAEIVAEASARRMSELVTREIASHTAFVTREVGNQVAKATADMTEAILKVCLEDARLHEVQRLQEQAVDALAEAAEARLELERQKVDAVQWRDKANRAKADLERLQTARLDWLNNFEAEEKCAVSVARDCLLCESSLELGAATNSFRKEEEQANADFAHLAEKASAELAHLRGTLLFTERCCDKQTAEIAAMQQNTGKEMVAPIHEPFLSRTDALAEIVADASARRISELLAREIGSHTDIVRRQVGESSLELYAATSSLRAEMEKALTEMAQTKEVKNTHRAEIAEGRTEIAASLASHEDDISSLHLVAQNALRQTRVLEMQSKSAIRQVQTEMADLRNSHENDLSSYRVAAENALQRSSCRYSELEATLGESRRESQRLKQQLQQVETKHGTSLEASDASARLSTTLELVRQEANSSRSEADSFRMEAHQSQVELGQAQKDLHKAAMDISHARQEALHSREEASNAQMALDSLKASLHEATSQAHTLDSVATLQGQLGAADEQVKEAKAKLEQVEESAAIEHAQLGNSQEQLKATAAKLKQAEQNAAAEQREASAQVKTLWNQLGGAHEELKELKVAQDQLAATKAKLKQSEEAAVSGKPSTVDASQDLEKVRESLKEAKADSRRLRRENLQLKEQLEKAASGDTGAAQSHLKVEIERLREENKKAQMKSQASQEESARVLREVHELQQQLRESRLETRKAQEQAGIVKDRKSISTHSRTKPAEHVAKTANIT